MHEKSIVVVDIDGTIADCTHRLHHLHPKEQRDWDAYYAKCAEDPPHEDMIQLVRALHQQDLTIFLLTGRREATRKDTESWLFHHMVPYHFLVMRPEGNRVDDHKWKPEVMKLIGLHNILYVLEDRDRIVKVLRDMGLRVLQVAPGDF